MASTGEESTNSAGGVQVTDVTLSMMNQNDKRDEDFDDASSDEENFGERCELEGFKPCSQCHLWKLMMSFYDRKGPESWSQGIVPHFITCNSFIGRSYAKVLHGFIRDCMKPGSQMPLDTNEPLYIIELGAGSGKFSFFMLKALDELKNICDFPINKIVYIMTDFTENNFNFWRDHPSLKKYFDNGMLDAGIFDAVNDQTITLRSGKVLGPGCSKNPICIVANYLFDTLYHDIFQVDNGVLKEGLVSTGSKRKTEPDPLDPDIIKRLNNLYQYNPISANSYYTQEDGDELHLGRILQWYQDCFSDNTNGASIVFPIGALRALRRLSTFSNNRMIVISGDKGNNNPEQFVGLMDPHIAVHGSFSLMVNYHAIGMWFTSRGGFALHNPQEEASLKVGCFVLTGASDDVILNDTQWLRATTTNPSNPDSHPAPLADILPGPPAPSKGLGPALTVQINSKGYRGSPSTISTDLMTLLTDKDNERSLSYSHLQFAFDDAVDTFGPNDFFVLQKSLKEDAPNPPLKSIVSLLKLGDWDPDVFFKFRDAVLNQIPNCGQKLRNDLCRGIPRVWENYYMLDLDKDIAFEIGRFFYGIRDYTNALNYYIESTNTVGEHHVTYHNQGLCYYSRGELETALKHFEKSLSMNQDYEKARSWVDKVKKELNKGGSQQTNVSGDGGEGGGGSGAGAGAGSAQDEQGNEVLSNSSSASTIDISESVERVGVATTFVESLVSNLSINEPAE